jgi:transposase
MRADMMRDMTGGGYQRVEVLTGPGRRRVWDEATKARVVAESYAPGAVASAVARRWQIAPQQLFTWRREARAASLEASRAAALQFVPIVSDPPAAEAASAGAGLEVALAGAVVRVSPGVDPALLSAVLRAVRALEP